MKKAHPSQLAVDLLTRSVCSVQVAAVLEDNWGIFSWGWNSSGPDGMGQHAEHHALQRANPYRTDGSTMWVAAQRKRNGKSVTAKPCPDCQRILKKYRILRVWWRDNDGKWKRMDV